MHQPSRRTIIHAGLGVMAGLGALPRLLAAAPPRTLIAPPKRALRITHLTDIHVQPERRGNDGMAACLRHVNSLADKPDLIITGGDQVMDTFDQGHDRAAALWDLWRTTLKNENSLPLHHVLGNHDIWGWNKKKSRLSGNEPNYGKAWALEMFARDRTYTSFDQGGWHIVILDSIQPRGDGYIARIDDAQFEWLEADLVAVPAETPTIIFSHVPIFAVCVYNDGDGKQKGNPDDWFINGGLMHTDAHRLRALFMKHPNVKLCMSGHIHQRDRVEFCGTTYICDGAVSGAWWKGRNKECDEGYGLIDLYDDGTFSHAYQGYGWIAQK